MITRRDLERAEQCTRAVDCPTHDLAHQGHNPFTHVDLETELLEWIDVHEALERAMSDPWDADSTMSEIAGRWIAHMATAHGAHCAGPHCAATAEAPAYTAVLRRMWDSLKDFNRPSDFNRGYRVAVRDLAHELGVGLDD